jgi:hypothetical protein
VAGPIYTVPCNLKRMEFVVTTATSPPPKRGKKKKKKDGKVNPVQSIPIHSILGKTGELGGGWLAGAAGPASADRRQPFFCVRATLTVV